MLSIIGLVAIAAHLVPGFHLNFPGNPDASGNAVVDWTFNPKVDPPEFKLLLACNCEPFPVLGIDVSSSLEVLAFNIQDWPNGEYWLRAVDDDNVILSNSDPFSLFAVESGLTLSPLPTNLPLTPIPGPLSHGSAVTLPPILTSTLSHANASPTSAPNTATNPMTTIAASTLQGSISAASTSVSTASTTLTSNVSLRNTSTSSGITSTISSTSESVFTTTSTLTGTTPVSTVFRSSSPVKIIVGSTVGGLAVLLLTILFLFFCRKMLQHSGHNRSRALTHDATPRAPEGPGFIVPFHRSSILLAENGLEGNSDERKTDPPQLVPRLDDTNMLEPRIISHEILPLRANQSHEQNYQPQICGHESQPNQSQEILTIAEPLVEIYTTNVGQGLASDKRQSHVLQFVRHTDIAEGVPVQVELPPEYCRNRPRLLGLPTSEVEVGSLIPTV